MKKIMILAGSVLALTAVSCSVDENKLEQPFLQGPRLTLNGTAFSDTKVSIGEKDGSVYPLLWGAGDVISIWSKDSETTLDEENQVVYTGKIAGEQAELFEGSAGSASGVFQTYNVVSVDSDEDVLILYPGSALSYSAGKISRNLPQFQEQRSASSSIHIGNYALSYAPATIKAGQTEGVTFSLTQKTAFMKVVLSTTEFSSLNLKGVKITAPGKVLSGDLTCDVNTGELSVENGFEYVGVKYRTPVPFSGTQELYFAAVPVDLTGTDVYVNIEMGDDSRNVTIPVKVQGGKLSEGCLTVLEINNVSTSLVDCEWYEPVETRDLVDGWAYGSQNTWFIEQKASGEGATEIKIDVKARGDFSKVRKPKYYGLYSGSSEMSTRKLIYLPNNVTAYEEQPVNTVADDWTITVYAYDQSQAGRWATVALYDEDYKIIWSYMIMKYVAGDEPSDVAYPGTDIVLLDRNLGSTYSNKLAEEKKTFDNAGAFFQWGRKDPFMWSNSGIDARYNQKYVAEDTDLATAIANPGIIFGYVNTGGVNSRGDWQNREHRTDLWGGVNNTNNWYDPSAVGSKTIYDPCPKGYRVPDARVFNEVGSKAERWEISNGSSMQDASAVNANSPFASTFSTLSYALGDGKYDYWPYAGAHWGSNNQWGNRTSSTNKHAALYWSNSVDPTALNQGVMLEYCYFSAETQFNARHASSRAHCYAIRCQKDEKGR